jgi:hypothetical protein
MQRFIFALFGALTLSFPASATRFGVICQSACPLPITGAAALVNADTIRVNMPLLIGLTDTSMALGSNLGGNDDSNKISARYFSVFASASGTSMTNVGSYLNAVLMEAGAASSQIALPQSNGLTNKAGTLASASDTAHINYARVQIIP